MKHSIFVWGLALLLVCGTVLADPATVTRAAEVRETPYVTGKVLGQLPRDSAVDIQERKGGWYRIKSPAFPSGWVRISQLKVAEASGARSFLGSLFESGRSGSRYTTGTTGVRGLDQNDLANAQPNAQALADVKGMTVNRADATQFAQELPVAARSVPALPEGAP